MDFMSYYQHTNIIISRIALMLGSSFVQIFNSARSIYSFTASPSDLVSNYCNYVYITAVPDGTIEQFSPFSFWLLKSLEPMWLEISNYLIWFNLSNCHMFEMYLILPQIIFFFFWNEIVSNVWWWLAHVRWLERHFKTLATKFLPTFWSQLLLLLLLTHLIQTNIFCVFLN